jgi:Sec-independent protein translocase protein TatA
MFGKIGLPEILLVLVIVLLREFRDGLQGTKTDEKENTDQTEEK